MHIAICDDNVADRHQIERLLKRESDKRSATTGILYVDSYGNADALLANPLQYDAYYIDICNTDGVIGLDIASKLFQTGIQAPVILCCSAINYRDYSLAESPGHILFLDKPIKAEELASTLDAALDIKSKSIPQIELRDDKKTYYVTENDILYTIADGRYLNITLADGRVIRVLSDTYSLARYWDSFPAFVEASTKIILNGRHIHSVVRRKVTMSDGAVFKIPRYTIKRVKMIWQECH